MKALSVKPLSATRILQGVKSTDCRTWKTDYRGPLLICASTSPWPAGTIHRHAVCCVDLVDVRPFAPEDLEAALMDEMPKKISYAWVYGSWRFVRPFEQKGRLHLFEVNDDLIRPIADDEMHVAFAEEHYRPLVRRWDSKVSEHETEMEWYEWMGRLALLDEKRAIGRTTAGLPLVQTAVSEQAPASVW